MLFKQIEYNKEDWLIFIGITAYAFLFSLLFQWPTITDAYTMSSDIRLNVYSYVSSWDSSLFRNDFIADYTKTITPIGVMCFYYILGLFVNPLLVVRYLPIAFTVISVMYIFRLGKHLKDSLAGALAAGMFLWVAWWKWKAAVFFSVGNGNDFGCLFTILYLYYFVTERYIIAGALIFLTTLFYPPLGLVCFGGYMLTMIRNFFLNHRVDRTGIIVLCIVALCMTAFLYKTYWYNPSLGLSGDTMRSMLEFYPGGRKPIFFPDWYTQITNNESGLSLIPPIQIMLIISAAIVLLRGNKSFSNVAPAFGYFLISCSVLFFLSYILLFKLAMPSRYMRLPLPLVLIFFITMNTKIRKKIQYVILMIILISGLSMPFCAPANISACYPGLCFFLKTLPKDSMIAGSPMLMDDVPLYSLRKAFVMLETSLPYYGIYPAVKKRTYDFYDAYYEEDIEKVYQFCVENDIDYLVVCKVHFDSAYLAKKDIYFEPLNRDIVSKIAGRRTFALRSIDGRSKVYEDPFVYVINVRLLPDVF